ncbi:hypothetical protein ACHAP5_004498 [Fusarium lateritium]
MVNSQDENLVPEVTPAPLGRAHDSPNDSAVLAGAANKKTRQTKQNDHTTNKMGNVSEVPSSLIKSEEPSSDGCPVAVSQTLDSSDGQSMEEMLEKMINILDKSHAETSEERYTIRHQLRSDYAQEASSLDKMIQSRLDNYLTHIKSVIQPFSKVARLHSQLKLEKIRYGELAQDHNKLLQRCKNQAEALQETTTKLENAVCEKGQQQQDLGGGSLVNSGKTTDDTIMSKWKELAYNIRCLAHALSLYPSAQQMDHVVERRLRSLSPIFLSLMQDRDYREFIMQGYLWSFVQDDVFDAKHPVWGGRDTRYFKTIRDNILAQVGETSNCSDSDKTSSSDLSLTHVAPWFAQGATMIGKLWANNTKTIRDVVCAEAGRLHQFYSYRQLKKHTVDKKIYDQLHEIVHSAIELDKIMMSSKAIFQIHWKDESQTPGMTDNYNEKVMEAICPAEEPTRQTRVRFYISPIVFKIGTADGRNYDNRMVLAKASVICD